MLKRIISAAIALPLLIFIVWKGGILLYAAVTIISSIGILEFYNSLRNKRIYPISWAGLLLSLFLLLGFVFKSDNLLFMMCTLIISIILLNIILFKKTKHTIIDVFSTLYGLMYIPLCLGHIILIDKLNLSVAIWLVFIIAWATDTSAYFTGYFLGKIKLCPNISPKKTVEGAIGGLIGSFLFCSIFAYIYLIEYVLSIMLLSILGSVVSQVGDLTASKIKRYVEIKDFGKIMPGHGGVLDRFDSILFIAPTVYYFLVFFIGAYHI